MKQFRQYLLGRHFVIQTDHAALSWLRKTPEPVPQLAWWLTLIEQYDYEVVHRHGKQHANADGLSRRPTISPITDDQSVQTTRVQTKLETSSVKNNRRTQSACALALDDDSDLTMVKLVDTDATPASVDEPSQQRQSEATESPTTSLATDGRRLSAPTNRLRSKVCNVDSEPEVVHLLVRENLADDQRTDAELGRVVQLRLETDEQPTNESIQTDSELTKKMVVKWDNLEVRNGLVYRRLDSPKPSTPTMFQLLVPRCRVSEVLRLCHTGTVGGHFGVKRTMVQVQRRFYWATWKTDVRKYCKSCSECSTYHRGKLSRQGRLKPVLAGAPCERWYIDLTGPHPRSDRGHVYILTCIDSFTKLAEAFPLRNKDAETIRDYQSHCRTGLHSLRRAVIHLVRPGKEVDGKVMQEVCRLFGIEKIKKLRTSAYKLSTNIVERFHKTLNSVLAKILSSHQRY